MKIAQLSILAFLFCIACTSEREAPNGLKVKVLRQGTGEFGAPGDFLVTNMIIKDTKDSVWRDSRDDKYPVIIPIGLATEISNEKGIESAFRVLKKGDSVEVPVDAKLLFGDQPLPPVLKEGDKLIYVFSVSEITDQRGINELQKEFQSRDYESSKMQSEGQLSLDTLAIDAYLATNKINAIKDKSGLRYVVTRTGKGDKPLLTNTVIVNYKGSLMEGGRVFDQSKGPFEYPLNGFIQGWQIGFQVLSKGATATFYIPSSLAYGVGGYQGIPPNANLIFEVELVDFK